MALGTTLTSTTGSIVLDSGSTTTLTDVVSADLMIINSSGGLTNSGDLTADGTMTLNTGSYTMGDATILTSTNGDIVIVSVGNVLASKMNAGGLIDITSTAGGLFDNLTAETANLTAATNISLSTFASTGTVSDSLDIAYGGKFDASTNGLYIVSENSMVVNSTGLNSGTGSMVLDITGDLTLEGSLTIGGTLTISQTGAFITNSGTYINAAGGFDTDVSGDFTMTGDFYITSAGLVDVNASGTIYLTSLTGLTGVNLNSETSNIVDNTAGELNNITTNGLASLTAVTGIGSAGDGDIDISAGSVNAVTNSGGVYLQSTGSLTIINAETLSGDITALAGGILNLNGNISSHDGTLTLSGQSINQTGDISAYGANTIDLTSTSGSVNMTGSTSVFGTGAITCISAKGILAGVFTTETSVNLTAQDGGIFDSSNSEILNINAETAVLEASGAIGDEEGDGINLDVEFISAISHSNGINIKIINGAAVINPGIWAYDGNVFLYTNTGEISNDGVVNSASAQSLGAMIGTVGTGTVSLYENWSGGAAIDDNIIFFLSQQTPFNNQMPAGGTGSLMDPFAGTGGGTGGLLDEFVAGASPLSIIDNVFSPEQQPVLGGAGGGTPSGNAGAGSGGGIGGLVGSLVGSPSNSPENFMPEASQGFSQSLTGSFTPPTISYENREITNAMSSFLEMYGNGVRSGSLFGGGSTGGFGSGLGGGLDGGFGGGFGGGLGGVLGGQLEGEGSVSELERRFNNLIDNLSGNIR